MSIPLAISVSIPFQATLSHDPLKMSSDEINGLTKAYVAGGHKPEDVLRAIAVEQEVFKDDDTQRVLMSCERMVRERAVESVPSRDSVTFAGDALHPVFVLLKAFDENWHELVEGGRVDERDPFSPYWGRRFLTCVAQFVRRHCGVEHDEADAVVADTTRQETRLEAFDGFVDQIDGDTAYVTLTSDQGDVLCGEYPVADLAAKGITERRRFRCETVKVHGEVQVVLESVAEKPLSAEEEEAIHRRIDELLADEELDGDS